MLDEEFEARRNNVERGKLAIHGRHYLAADTQIRARDGRCFGGGDMDGEQRAAGDQPGRDVGDAKLVAVTENGIVTAICRLAPTP
jgi:hypothetical protein